MLSLQRSNKNGESPQSISGSPVDPRHWRDPADLGRRLQLDTGASCDALGSPAPALAVDAFDPHQRSALDWAAVSWAGDTLERDLDDILEDGQPVAGMQIQDLLAFLRVGGHVVDIDRATISGSNTVARHASVIRDFLKWAVDPTSQGRSQMVSFDEIRHRRACLDEVFHAVTRQSGASRRIRPLTDKEVTHVERLIGPRRKDDGSLIVPLQFPRVQSVQD